MNLCRRRGAKHKPNQKMKMTLTQFAGAAFLGAFLAASPLATAQVVQETTTTTSAGTITEFGPETIIIRTETAPQPIRYISRKTTTYVDETGAPVSIETVKSGLPVTVHYVREGDQMIASRVIVRRATTGTTVPVVRERQTTTTVPAAPVIQERKSTTTTTTTDTNKKKSDD